MLVPLFAGSCHGGLFGAGSGSGGYEVVGRRLETFPNGATVPVEEPAVAAARANHLAAVAAARGWSFHEYNTKTREGLKTSEIAKVRKKRFFLGESGLNLAALLAVDILPTGIIPTNFILVRLTVKVEEEE